jgi:hypothetical protein
MLQCKCDSGFLDFLNGFESQGRADVLKDHILELLKELVPLDTLGLLAELPS